MASDFDGLDPAIIVRPDKLAQHRPGQLEAIDEIVAHNAMVHIERLDDNHIWARIDVAGKAIRLSFWTRGRAKLYFGGENDSAPTEPPPDMKAPQEDRS